MGVRAIGRKKNIYILEEILKVEKEERLYRCIKEKFGFVKYLSYNYIIKKKNQTYATNSNLWKEKNSPLSIECKYWNRFNKMLTSV